MTDASAIVRISPASGKFPPELSNCSSALPPHLLPKQPHVNYCWYRRHCILHAISKLPVVMHDYFQIKVLFSKISPFRPDISFRQEFNRKSKKRKRKGGIKALLGSCGMPMILAKICPSRAPPWLAFILVLPNGPLQ